MSVILRFIYSIPWDILGLVLLGTLAVAGLTYLADLGIRWLCGISFNPHKDCKICRCRPVE